MSRALRGVLGVTVVLGTDCCSMIVVSLIGISMSQVRRLQTSRVRRVNVIG